MILSLLLSALVAVPAPTLVPVPATTISIEAPSRSIEFRVKNDTGSSVRLHTGRGTSTIVNGSSNRYSADAGTEFRLDSSRGALLFEVSSDMDGETLDLSDYM